MSGARHYRKRRHRPVERPILPDEIERILQEIAEERHPPRRQYLPRLKSGVRSAQGSR